MDDNFATGISAGIFIGIIGISIIACVFSFFIPNEYSVKELQQMQQIVCKQQV